MTNGGISKKKIKEEPPSNGEKKKCGDECLTCRDKFETRRDRTKPVHETDFVCQTCNIKLKHKRSLVRHEKTCNEQALTCKECGEKCSNKLDHNRHMRTKHGIQKAEWVCRTCHRDFKAKGALTTHRIKGCLFFMCETCQKNFPSQKLLTRHKKSGHEIEKYVCFRCNFTCSSRSELICHQQTCKGIICKHCEERFDTMDELQSHYSDKHKRRYFYYAERLIGAEEGRSQTVTRRDEDDKLKLENFVCRICNEEFLDEEGLRNHLEMTHSGSESHSSTSSGLFIVEDAEDDESSPAEEEKEKRTKRKPSEDEDDEHRQKRLKSEEMFDCVVGNCPERFENENELMIHLQVNHKIMPGTPEMEGAREKATGEHIAEEERVVVAITSTSSPEMEIPPAVHVKEPFFLVIEVFDAVRETVYGKTCDICDVEFLRDEEFVNHREAEHSDYLPYKCVLCSEKCSTVGDLIDHYKFHDIIV